MGPGFVAKPKSPKLPPKWKQAKHFAQMRAKRSIRCAEALQLRQSGLTFKVIGEHFGVSPTMASCLVRRGAHEIERGLDVSETGWMLLAEKEKAEERAEMAQWEAKRKAEEQAAERAVRACQAKSRDGLKRAWGRWQVEMYQARPARIAEPAGDDVVCGHALQQLWRQFIEPRTPPVGHPPTWLRWTDTAGVTYRDVPGRLVPEWRIRLF